MNVDKTPIITEIADVKARIACYDYTLAESRHAAKQVADLTRNISADMPAADLKAAQDAWAEYSDLIGYANDVRFLENLETTLAADLMQVSTRYVVTDTPHLESPAGFHPDTGIFLQTTIAIHTDTLKGLPYCNRKMYGHEVNK